MYHGYCSFLYTNKIIYFTLNIINYLGIINILNNIYHTKIKIYTDILDLIFIKK